MSRSVLNFAESDGTASYPLFTALWGDVDIATPLAKIDPEATTALAFSRSPGRGAHAACSAPAWVANAVTSAPSSV